jgi:hypothetical protein
VLAITERRGGDIVTDIHPLVDLHVAEDGRFTLSDREGRVQISGQAQRDLGVLGEGHARVTLRSPTQARVLEAQLFFWAEDSWARRMAELEAKATLDKAP